MKSKVKVYLDGGEESKLAAEVLNSHNISYEPVKPNIKSEGVIAPEVDTNDERFSGLSRIIVFANIKGGRERK